MTAYIKKDGVFEDRDFEVLHDATVSHYTKLGLYGHATALRQQVYALGEAGKLSVDGVLKNDLDEIKDGIGDVLICLINWAHLKGVDFMGAFYRGPYVMEMPKYSPEELCLGLHCEISTVENKDDLYIVFRLLISIAVHYGFTLAQCLGHAYDVVFSRKVKPLNGTLVKEADWHKYPELERVAVL